MGTHSMTGRDGAAPAVSMRHRRGWIIALVLLALVLALALIALFPRAAAAGQSARSAVLADGRQEYEENCVACHGADGTGGGELAPKLVKPPKDLTQIAATSGGSFPFWRVFDIISGEAAVIGHDTHQMPQFFESLQAQNFKPGYLPAHVRILELTHYVESLQRN